MALIRLNNQSISSVTALPGGIGGKVLQYKTVKSASGFQTTSTSLAEISTNFRLTITPTSASNRIILRFYLAWLDNYAGGNEAILAFYRNINGAGFSNLANSESKDSNHYYNWNASRFQANKYFDYIDTTHNTTSSIVYTMYGKTGNNGTADIGVSNRFSIMEAIEVAD
jgi:hypothetical protein